jgi:hypothetical protein
MVNSFVYQHDRPRSNRWEDMRHVHFRDLGKTPYRSTEVKGHCGFWTSGVNFPIVFHSNHRSILHRLAATHLSQTTDRQQCSIWPTFILKVGPKTFLLTKIFFSCMFSWKVTDNNKIYLFGQQSFRGGGFFYGRRQRSCLGLIQYM